MYFNFRCTPKIKPTIEYKAKVDTDGKLDQKTRGDFTIPAGELVQVPIPEVSQFDLAYPERIRD